MKCAVCNEDMDERRTDTLYKDKIRVMNVIVRSCDECYASEIVIPKQDELDTLIEKQCFVWQIDKRKWSAQ